MTEMTTMTQQQRQLCQRWTMPTTPTMDDTHDDTIDPAPAPTIVSNCSCRGMRVLTMDGQDPTNDEHQMSNVAPPAQVCTPPPCKPTTSH
jgi:hypothetical protein